MSNNEEIKPLTAEEFIREKVRERNAISGEMQGLFRYQVTAEDSLRWAHEFKEIHTTALQKELTALRVKRDLLNSDLQLMTTKNKLNYQDSCKFKDERDNLQKEIETLREENAKYFKEIFSLREYKVNSNQKIERIESQTAKLKEALEPIIKNLLGFVKDDFTRGLYVDQIDSVFTQHNEKGGNGNG